MQILTIKQLFELYKRERLPSEATIKNYKYLLKVFIRDTNCANTNDIDHSIILSWRDKVLARASINTWNTYLRQMKSLFTFAVKCEYLIQSPFKRIKTITTYKTKPKILDTGLIEEMIKKCNFLKNGWFWKIVINILYSTGMRRKQLITICWNDINFNDRTIRLSATGSKTKIETLVPIRTIEIKPLINLKNRSKAANFNLKQNDQVFNISLFSTHFKNNNMSCDNVSSFFKRLSKIMDAKISAHRFRHTMATKCANEGYNIKALQNFLGHTNLSTTLRYVHPKIEDLRKLQNIL